MLQIANNGEPKNTFKLPSCYKFVCKSTSPREVRIMCCQAHGFWFLIMKVIYSRINDRPTPHFDHMADGLKFSILMMSDTNMLCLFLKKKKKKERKSYAYYHNTHHIAIFGMQLISYLSLQSLQI